MYLNFNIVLLHEQRRFPDPSEYNLRYNIIRSHYEILID